MVEFCTACGTSLPKGDLTFRKGSMYTSADYVCPSCGEMANPGGEPPEPPGGPAVSADQDVVIRKGAVSAG